MKSIYPCLWFDDQAEEAVNFYVSLFPNSQIMDISRYGPGAPLPEGTAFVIRAELNGQQVMALNGGPQHFGFSEAISFFVNCEGQAEVDRLWEKFSEGGEPGPCGWIKDKYGLWWQVVPTALGELMGDSDPVKAGRVAQAMLKMNKLDVAELQRAYDGQA